MLNLPERVEVPEQDVAEPLGIDAGDLPLLGLLVLEPHGPGETGTTVVTVRSGLPADHLTVFVDSS